VSESFDFPFLDPVAADYHAESHLLGHGAQKLFLARRAQHPDDVYLMGVDWYKGQDIASLRNELGYRIPGVFELALIARFDEHGVNAKRDAERREHWAMLEKLPEGDWLPRVLAGLPRSSKSAVTMAIAAGRILQSAANAGVLMIGVRPEYMWGRATSDGIELTGLSARGHTFFKIVKPRSTFTAPLFERIYSAPEVVRREPADDRALTFTLALLVAEWATGHYPFPDAWVAGSNTSLITGAHAPLALPPALESLISRCLQPKVDTRPRLTEFVDALRSVPVDEAARRL
jgi:hypothetical protein